MQPHPTLTIGTLAARSGCNVPTIRYYEEIGLLAPASRRSGGHRMFGESDMRRLTLIRRCRDLGFPIERIRALVALADDPKRDCFEAREMAEVHLDEVRAKLAALRALERNLARFVKSCATACKGGRPADCAVLEDLAAPNKMPVRSRTPTTRRRTSVRR
ncbi:MAG: MerR family transcriptional regulator [Alphaproteobacteria bacterium]